MIAWSQIFLVTARTLAWDVKHTHTHIDTTLLCKYMYNSHGTHVENSLEEILMKETNFINH